MSGTAGRMEGMAAGGMAAGAAKTGGTACAMETGVATGMGGPTGTAKPPGVRLDADGARPHRRPTLQAVTPGARRARAAADG